MLHFLGRLHLLVLHLPIGLLSFAFLHVIFGRHRPEWKIAAHAALSAGAIVAPLSAICGWLLAREGGYDEHLLFWHRWLGVTTAVLAVATWFWRNTRAYLPLLTACVLVLAGTGHFGGSLTHGENYLFAQKDASDRVPSTVNHPPSTVVFTGLIEPILQAKCVSCHSAAKHKGGLALDSPEGLLAGGKHGAVLFADHPDSSALLLRLALPLAHDDHMPPAGKPQLTADELALLRWWITQGADFQKTLSEMPLTPEVEKVLTQTETVHNPVFDLNVEAADEQELVALRRAGAAVTPLGAENPWLAVSFAGNSRLTEKGLAALQAVAEQVVDLDLSNSNLDDRLLAALPALPHLTRLHLAQTALSDAGLGRFGASFPYLDFLNLSGTAISDAGLGALSSLSYLRSLYVWRTGVSAAPLANLQQQLPALKADLGAPPDTSSAPLPLRPPKILFGRNLFDDTVQVSLEFPRLVEVYYTLDEASPTTQALHYDNKPLIFNATTKLRAIAAKPGWANSPVVEASFVRRKYAFKSAVLARPPSPKYPGNGATSLLDGRISDSHLDKTYLGYEGEHLDAVLDLGEARELSRLSLHCLENNGSWIFAPRGLQVWTSNDGKTWNKQVERRYAVNTSMQGTKTHLLSEPFSAPSTCRYVKVRVESLLKNPPWHPGKGQKCWLFVDEMLVE